ncbi:mitochondrial 37S ribosomal protein rsm10 [Puttea exsequens]|nr:mitochondrial 37S ribosomal protein rsm10 [Puttea exsequens]
MPNAPQVAASTRTDQFMGQTLNSIDSTRGPLSLTNALPEQGRRGRPRLPRSVQAIYLRPLKRKAQYGVPVCDLQIRSYSVRNLEFFADFALRAAYYLNLPAAGPVPLPRITERWTVPRSHFIHKKSQENFERITMRRLVQIQDGHPDSVEIWLAFLKKHAYYGIGMKANVWRHEKLGVGKTMDVSLENLKQAVGPRWAHFGRRKTLETSERAFEMMRDETFQETVETL